MKAFVAYIANQLKADEAQSIISNDHDIGGTVLEYLVSS